MHFEIQQDLGRALSKSAFLCRLLLKIHYFGKYAIVVLDVIWICVKIRSLLTHA